MGSGSTTGGGGGGTAGIPTASRTKAALNLGPALLARLRWKSGWRGRGGDGGGVSTAAAAIFR